MNSRRTRSFWIPIGGLLAVIAALWLFPAFWYTNAGEGDRIWFNERTEIAGWSFEPVPISASAERVLVADRTVNGEFRREGEAVRVFSAKRFVENSNEIGLFVHTPDRCWVEGGWRIQPIAPEVQEVSVHGVMLRMERRLFEFGNNRELVYFCGLVDGRTLPYRLDHNLSVGLRTAGQGDPAGSGARGRASDLHFWQRLWDSFESRRALSGPKQFLRISTPVRGEDLEDADERLRIFLSLWLEPGDFSKEREKFRAVAAR
jgi:hypothetical protein